MTFGPRGFPRLYAAASLKPRIPWTCEVLAPSFPRLYAAASLKLHSYSYPLRPAPRRFPRLYAAASLKLPEGALHRKRGQSFPRLYAAASLKRIVGGKSIRPVGRFSAALCRGLIAALRSFSSLLLTECFPRLYAAASLKPVTPWTRERHGAVVFRGFMPRPH